MALTYAPRRVLVIRTDRLGETLLNLPVLAALKEAFPDSVVTWMVNATLLDLVLDAPGVDRTIGYEEDERAVWWVRAIRLCRRLRSEGFELALVSNPKKEFHVATWLAGIPTRVGYDRKWPWTLTHRVADPKVLGERHEVEYNLELLRTLGIVVPLAPSLQLAVSEQEERGIFQLLEQLKVMSTERLVAIHPWTSNPKKQWPLARFRELIQRLRQIPKVVVAVIGGKDEQTRVQELVDEPDPGLVDLVGRLSLRQLAALFRRVRVLLSNDSGPVHLAAAVGTPTVVLFGTPDPATGPTRWGPWGGGHTVIWKSAMEDIAVEEVVQAIHRYLPG